MDFICYVSLQAVSKTEESKPDDAKNVDKPDDINNEVVVVVDENKKSDQPENPTTSQTTSAIITSSSPPVTSVAQDRERTKKDEQVMFRRLVKPHFVKNSLQSSGLNHARVNIIRVLKCN